MRKFQTWPSIAAAVVLTVGALACSSGNTPATPSTTSNSTQTGGGTTSATGQMSVFLTDSPFSDAKALLVTFSDVSVHSADTGEWKTVSSTSRTCDLKKLTNSATDVLGVALLPGGKYTQVRLNVMSASIYFDNASSSATPCAASIAAPAGTSAAVDIPSGQVILNHEFTVTGAGTKMTLDFDGDQSVRQTGSGNGNGNGNPNSNSKYMMTPVIRVVSVG